MSAEPQKDFNWIYRSLAWARKATGWLSTGTATGWTSLAGDTHLVRVQEGVADDVLADVGRRGQAVQPVE